MKKLLVAALLASSSVGAFAADTYQLDSTHTYPTFEISHMGYSITRGTFDKTSGTLSLDLAAKKGSLEAVIDTTSLDTGFDKRDEHLKSPDFFNVEKFPTATVKADKFVFEGDKLVAAEGSLTLLGVSKPVKLNVVSFKCAPSPMTKKDTCGAEVVANIKRSDFGMTTYLPAVGDDVKISVQVEAVKK
ncbi:YceI family protein [Leeia sp. TBRC 13508]|uniref:YceI family protein n=1 Tax=Leeia speluncae TaxID=2884804 RepID=A0ABS8D5U0_9NEIS|nr:YceI family protein [Leeia speluncae]MCB6183580.1 YceI family protein [Leeia speluncae]